MKLVFFLPMEPPTVTHQMKRVGVSKKGKTVVYEDARLKDARQKLTAHLMHHAPESPVAGPISLQVQWLFADRNQRHGNGAFKTSKPDTDNLNKLLKDCMTACHFWKDDAQVAVEHIEKRWTREMPGILIEISDLCD